MTDAERAHIEALERRLETEGGWKGTPRGEGGFRIHVAPGAETTYQGDAIPVSRSMPLSGEKGVVVNRFGQSVRQLKSGHYATLDGKRIVDSRAARDAHAKECGMVVE